MPTTFDPQHEITELKNEIAKLRFQVFTLATLLGNVIDGEKVSGSIHEMSVLLDLSKDELKQSHQLIANYDGDMKRLLATFKNPTDKINAQSIFILAQAYRNSGMMIEKCERLLKDKTELYD